MGITSGNAVGKERPVDLRRKRKTVFQLPSGERVAIYLAGSRRGSHLVVCLPDGATIIHESLTLPQKSA